MKAERQHEEATSRVLQRLKSHGKSMVDNRKQAVDQSKLIDCIQQKTNVSVIQRATVAGVRNDSKTALEIGNDMHELVQGEFLESGLPRKFKLFTEFVIGGGRADLVAINDERGDDGIGDCCIYVGEIKSDSLQWYGPGSAYTQLSSYIDAFEKDPSFEGASVRYLDFWNPPTSGIPICGNGYNCTVFIQNRGNGLYTYTGRVTAEGIAAIEDRLEDQDSEELPYNEQPNSYFS